MARHPYTVPDHALWDDLKSSVKALRQRNSKTAGSKLPGTSAAPLGLRAKHLASHPGHASLPPPPLAAFDRRTAQKLGRGQLEPDARIDLHGETLEAAHTKLLHFLGHQQRHGHRLVLVITGKGTSPYAGHTLHGFRMTDSPERNGRMRRELPFWLEEHAFRTHVIGFQPAHPRHGGGGAFYVRLRRTGAHP